MDVSASVEKRKRELGVALGRLQVKVMEIIRELEQAERNTKGLIERNTMLEKLLGAIGKGKQENLEDTEAEIVRREEVVKIMKLELKVMKRERMLERDLRLYKEYIGKWRMFEDLVESHDRCHVRTERLLDILQSCLWKFEFEYNNNNSVEIEELIKQMKKDLEELRKKLPNHAWWEGYVKAVGEQEISIRNRIVYIEKIENSRKDDELEAEKFY